MGDSQTFSIVEKETREPGSSDRVQVEDGVPATAWSEEERHRIAAFFRLVDQWDRELSKARQAA